MPARIAWRLPRTFATTKNRREKEAREIEMEIFGLIKKNIQSKRRQLLFIYLFINLFFGRGERGAGGR